MAVERFPVEAGHVLMFARSIGDPNPVYSDAEYAAASEVGGVIAPPTFVQAGAQFDPDYGLRPKIGRPWFGSGRTPSGLQRPAAPAEPAAAESQPSPESSSSSERRPRSGGGTGLHAEQHYTYHRPLRVGDVLTATTTPGKRWEKQGRRAGVLVFAESVTEYRDQDGELVVTARSVAVRTERAVQS
ncbi:MAG TPA: MaoC family dehydratase N-terminal domain-containing protein [Acidimicrobiales bacterium]|nr:MaoC family dehydratase N-terminal domain-containing protein [Acidimicrobiales bacterium]